MSKMVNQTEVFKMDKFLSCMPSLNGIDADVQAIVHCLFGFLVPPLFVCVCLFACILCDL